MMEQEFYDFAKSQFHFMKRLTFGSSFSDNNINVADEARQVNLSLLLFYFTPFLIRQLPLSFL